MSRKTRWYDENTDLSHLISLFLVFPPNIQAVLARHIIRYCEHELKSRDEMRGFKSLGAEKIVQYNRSKQRQRNYDTEHLLHRAMNCLTILPPESQSRASRRMIDVTSFVLKYLEFCRIHHFAPLPNEVKRLIQKFEEGGSREAAKYLKSIENALAPRMSATRSTPPQTVVDEEGVMLMTKTNRTQSRV